MVRLYRVAREGRDYLVRLVDDDVDDIGELRHARGALHVAVDRVAVDDAHARLRVVYEVGAVVAEHRNAAAYAGKDALAPARVARKEMRLNKALGDDEVGLRDERVDDEARARGQRAEVCERR